MADSKSATDSTTYDAIVVGSGIAGGWAAKELCEKGLKTLVLERGRNVEHIKDYPTANLAPWQLPHRGRLTRKVIEQNPVMSVIAAEDVQHFFVKDADHPYVQEKPFDWIRGYQVGGKSIVWGRACQRWSHYEFTAPERHGYGIGWPIGYEDIAPWYSHVERFIGVCGTRDGIESMPDGEFLPAVRLQLRRAAHERQDPRALRQSLHGARPLGSPHAARADPSATGTQRLSLAQPVLARLSLRRLLLLEFFNAAVGSEDRQHDAARRRRRAFHHLRRTQEPRDGRARDRPRTHQLSEYRARIVFVTASALNTVLILLNSTSSRFPHGLGNDNGLLGKYVAFQNYRSGGGATIDGFDDEYYFGRRPSECIVANFRNLGKKEMDFVGGYTMFTGAYRNRGKVTPERMGGAYKDAQAQPGPWHVYMYLQGETVPKESNHVRLHETLKDEWGIPQLVTSVAYDDNDERMIRDFRTQCAEMLEVAGCRDIETDENNWNPGRDIHEMGGCRMGRDAKTSLLNRSNQLHACPNVFVTDGACMTSTGNQSPSLLYMALTARAVNHAVEELNRQNL